jgi:hypothetical protein
MILYGVDNIRDLFGTKARSARAAQRLRSASVHRSFPILTLHPRCAQVNLSMIKSNPICRLNIDNTG